MRQLTVDVAVETTRSFGGIVFTVRFHRLQRSETLSGIADKCLEEELDLLAYHEISDK